MPTQALSNIMALKTRWKIPKTLDWLSDKISDLPQREQLILSLYYTDEMNLREIGAILEISESRVSQILTKTVQVLREKLIK